MRAKRVKLISGGGGGGDDEAELADGQEEEEEEEEDIQYKNVQEAAADDDEDVDEKNPHNKTLLELTRGINGETAKQRIESAVYQFAVGVMFVRKCLVASCGVSDTYTFDTELKQFYARHPHLREELGPGHVPPGSSAGEQDDAKDDDDDDDMYIPQRK